MKTKLLRRIAAEDRRRQRDERREERRRRRRLRRSERHGAGSPFLAGAPMHDDPDATPEQR
jgi:hypothetical protein